MLNFDLVRLYFFLLNSNTSIIQTGIVWTVVLYSFLLDIETNISFRMPSFTTASGTIIDEILTEPNHDYMTTITSKRSVQITRTIPRYCMFI